jgi:dolichyl-phosphate-mannose--protein O-mannosyl transferase
MCAAGLALGLALSTRWTSLWAWGFLGLVLLAVRGKRILQVREIALTVLAFAALPFALYLLSYLPWIRQGHEWSELAPHTKAIWHYHATLNATHPYFSKWWTWPWLVRPTWYYFKQDPETHLIRGIVAIGNPALWWASVPVSVWAIATGVARRDPRRLFSGLGFALLYLPWGISPRTLNYSHYLFEAIPYACLSLGMLLDRDREDPWWPAAQAYLGLVAALFLFFLPFLTALPVPASWFYARLGGGGPAPWTWFRSWI